ncbi:hypothetical protein C8F04DRAFT_954397 [Mycena alexandri]|uniref:CxC2-like cysteine cluster KDZ transposase-associated domain-containing protein n=1 Tax=Mycena alexandri TaxID=1745969 RepID=A0AAD6SZG1_9AGAR|nr:hypothetical protein C8F04DRAFT_954397 [Mycena alexandri]
MKAFTENDNLEGFEAAIFSTRTHPTLAGNSTPDCACGAVALFRCPECTVTTTVCAVCLVKMHPNHHIHHVERWDGAGFVRVRLFDLKHEVHLGHQGFPCPQAPKDDDGQPRPTSGREMVIVDTNGIHKARVFFCHCGIPRKRDRFQLAEAGLFPGTVETPGTAFTFEVLDNFHVHNLTSKKTARDYYRALQKLTDGAFPHKVANRYREFLRVVRLWRYFTMRRRSGQSFNIDDVITTRRKNSMAVRCPACPEIGFNVEKKVVLIRLTQGCRHKYTMFLSSDGNFKLQRKRKVDDPDDIALNAGNAYFVEDSEYQGYVSKVGPADDVRSNSTIDPFTLLTSTQKCTCSELKAVRMQNIAKFKSSVVSGVVAVQCARHGLFMPGGVVDLYRGEGYAHTDYALGMALGDCHDHRWIFLTYDVYCQYFKNITTRFGKWFPSLMGFIDRLGGAVPKMHIRNHIAQCQTQWSTNFQEYLGFLIGELIEGSWAELNQFAGSTKETNQGHRHDILDDGFAQWNWDKVIQMADTLLKMYREACAAVRARSPAFDELTNATPPALVQEWEAMPKTWKIKDGKYTSPYEASIKHGPPTHRTAYEKLITAELTKSIASGEIGPGNTEFIARGLMIEQEQYVGITRRDWLLIVVRRHRINTILKTSAIDKATNAKSKLRKQFTPWRIAQVDRFPKLKSEIANRPLTTVEKEKLFFPSEFNEPARNSLGMLEAGTIEYKLREGQAYDALEEVRQAIKTFNFNVAFKISNIGGQPSNTRAQNFLRILANARVVEADRYRRARGALLQLGLSDVDANLRPLVNSDLYAKNTREMPKMGESKQVDPWIWTAGRPENMTPKEEEAWIDRVKWFRDRANRDRAVEQVELVEVKVDRTIKSFEKNAEVWKTLETRSVTGSGKAAYAHVKSLMYSKLATECAATWAKAGECLKKDEAAELKGAEEELREQGLLNAKYSVDWKVRVLRLAVKGRAKMLSRTISP